MSFSGFLLGLTGFHRLEVGFHKFYLVLLGFIDLK